MNTQFWISDTVEVVSSCGAFAYPLHTHTSTLVLNYVRSGQITLYFPAKILRFGAGECFTILPHVPHRLSRSADSDVISVCCATHTVCENGLLNSMYVLNILENLLNQELLAVREADAFKKTLLLISPIMTDVVSSGDAITRQLVACLETYPEAHDKLAGLTRQYGRSVWHAIRRFQEVTGLTPHQFQMQNRIRQAKRLLQKTDSLTDVALSAGFCDQSHLNRCLRRALGLTPARYRAACRSAQCRKKFSEQA